MQRLFSRIFVIGFAGILISSGPVYGQSSQNTDCGGKIGITFSFGSAINRLGVTAGGYVIRDGGQLNLHARWYYNFTSLGPSQSGSEAVVSLGGLFAWGEEQKWENRFVTSVGNQTGKKYSLAYAYNYYVDQISTSQPTGTIAAQIDTFHIITENDALGFQGGDKFRTGAVLLAIQNKKEQFGLNTILWTGNASKQIKKIKESSYPGRYGYKDLQQAPYGNLSHGILSLQYDKVLDGYQTIQGRLGIDAEQVRHFLQNKVMHDMYFVPEPLMATKNLHIPMLDAKGNAYLFDAAQTIRPARFFFSAAMNPSLFY